MVKKSAQQYDSNNILDLENFMPSIIENKFSPIEVSDDIEVSEDSPDEIIFLLDEIPGAPNAKEIIIEDENDDKNVIIQEDDDIFEYKQELSKFLDWLKNMIDNVPAHSGYDSTGLEKAISYFEALDRLITKVIRMDFKNEIDSAKAESAREQIQNGIQRMYERLDNIKETKFKNRKKKSNDLNENYNIVKEAGTTNVTGITITVPLLISRIARVCINGMISAGHDIEDMFERQAEEYDLDKRERAELSQLLSDMGFPMLQDRGLPVGTPVEIWKNDNFDWAAQYKS